jgi:tRNA pseudouridine38-40 synthase
VRNVLITIEYDGSGFHGWQIQPHRRTVQGELEQTLSSICGETIRLHGTSRTDAGVHAYGQTAHFTGNFRIPAERIPIAANNLLRDIRICGAEERSENFHARYDAVGKTYCYRIRVGKQPDIFVRNYRYLLNEALNTSKMEEASKHLIGTCDFMSFQASGSAIRESTVRTLYDFVIEKNEMADSRGRLATEISLRVRGNGFLYNMVRIIAGTLVEVGQGRKRPEDMEDIINGKDRRAAGHTAPPGGLYLEKVHFDRGGAQRV